MAHPNVQQLLASIWYEGLPGFRQMNMILQGLEVVRIGLLFPFFSMAYIICPWIGFSQKLRKPFIKFICTSASYFTFLCKALFHTFLSKNSTLQKTKMKFLLKLSFCTKIWVEKCVLRKWRLLFLSLQLIYLHCSRLSARASQVLSAFFHWSKSLLQNPLAADLYYFFSSSMLRTIGRELLAVFFALTWAHSVEKYTQKFLGVIVFFVLFSSFLIFLLVQK